MDGRLPIYAAIAVLAAWAFSQGLRTGKVWSPNGSYLKAEQRWFYWFWIGMHGFLVVTGLVWTIGLTWDALT